MSLAVFSRRNGCIKTPPGKWSSTISPSLAFCIIPLIRPLHISPNSQIQPSTTNSYLGQRQTSFTKAAMKLAFTLAASAFLVAVPISASPIISDTSAKNAVVKKDTPVFSAATLSNTISPATTTVGLQPEESDTDVESDGSASDPHEDVTTEYVSHDVLSDDDDSDNENHSSHLTTRNLAHGESSSSPRSAPDSNHDATEDPLPADSLSGRGSHTAEYWKEHLRPNSHNRRGSHTAEYWKEHLGSTWHKTARATNDYGYKCANEDAELRCKNNNGNVECDCYPPTEPAIPDEDSPNGYHCKYSKKRTDAEVKCYSMVRTSTAEICTCYLPAEKAIKKDNTKKRTDVHVPASKLVERRGDDGLIPLSELSRRGDLDARKLASQLACMDPKQEIRCQEYPHSECWCFSEEWKTYANGTSVATLVRGNKPIENNSGGSDSNNNNNNNNVGGPGNEGDDRNQAKKRDILSDRSIVTPLVGELGTGGPGYHCENPDAKMECPFPSFPSVCGCVVIDKDGKGSFSEMPVKDNDDEKKRKRHDHEESDSSVAVDRRSFGGDGIFPSLFNKVAKRECTGGLCGHWGRPKDSADGRSHWVVDSERRDVVVGGAGSSVQVAERASGGNAIVPGGPGYHCEDKEATMDCSVGNILCACLVTDKDGKQRIVGWPIKDEEAKRKRRHLDSDSLEDSTSNMNTVAKPKSKRDTLTFEATVTLPGDVVNAIKGKKDLQGRNELDEEEEEWEEEYLHQEQDVNDELLGLVARKNNGYGVRDIECKEAGDVAGFCLSSGYCYCLQCQPFPDSCAFMQRRGVGDNSKHKRDLALAPQLEAPQGQLEDRDEGQGQNYNVGQIPKYTFKFKTQVIKDNKPASFTCEGANGALCMTAGCFCLQCVVGVNACEFVPVGQKPKNDWGTGDELGEKRRKRDVGDDGEEWLKTTIGENNNDNLEEEEKMEKRGVSGPSELGRPPPVTPGKKKPQQRGVFYTSPGVALGVVGEDNKDKEKRGGGGGSGGGLHRTSPFGRPVTVGRRSEEDDDEKEKRGGGGGAHRTSPFGRPVTVGRRSGEDNNEKEKRGGAPGVHRTSPFGRPVTVGRRSAMPLAMPRPDHQAFLEKRNKGFNCPGQSFGAFCFSDAECYCLKCNKFPKDGCKFEQRKFFRNTKVKKREIGSGAHADNGEEEHAVGVVVPQTVTPTATTPSSSGVLNTSVATATATATDTPNNGPDFKVFTREERSLVEDEKNDTRSPNALHGWRQHSDKSVAKRDEPYQQPSYPAGNECTHDGAWVCPDGKSYQQCASLKWTPLRQLAAGTKCPIGYWVFPPFNNITADTATTTTTTKKMKRETAAPVGSACSPIGSWNCIDGKSYQQCAPGGVWTAAMPTAAGTGCAIGFGNMLNITITSTSTSANTTTAASSYTKKKMRRAAIP